MWLIIIKKKQKKKTVPFVVCGGHESEPLCQAAFMKSIHLLLYSHYPVILDILSFYMMQHCRVCTCGPFFTMMGTAASSFMDMTEVK